MKNVRISKTVALTEVPREIDNMVRDFEIRCQNLTSLAKTVSFSKSVESSLLSIRSAQSLVQDLETILADCENLAQGLVEINSKLAQAEAAESAESSATTAERLEPLIPEISNAG